MRKLNLLMPDVHTGYLGTRKKERVRYLSIPSDLSMKMIEDDLKTGEVIFQGLHEQMKKPACRTVVIRTNSEEAGLMAVCYLAAAYNRMDHRHDRFGEEADDGLSESADLETYEEDEEYDEEFIDEYEEESKLWEESPSRVPIVEMNEIRNFAGMDNFSIFQDRSFHMQGNGYAGQKDPYWTDCNRESICIMCRSEGFGSQYMNFNDHAGRYFQKNRHVYIVEIRNLFIDDTSGEGVFDDASEECEDGEFVRMVLEEAAAVVDLFYEDKEKREKLIQYRTIQFENWIARKGLTLSQEFPTEKIVSRILRMRNPNKSELMGQILKYMQVQGNVIETVTEKDFDILSRFAKIGAGSETEKNSSTKLEEQLFGMENVKQQVREIVEVQRYQKRRESFGLTKGGYHNVHLLIGAPGTAKTTVAKLMGTMMSEAHLLPGNRFICVNGADLKGLYVGHTAPKVRQIFADNDIIMIDEAYSLTSQCSGESGDSFSQEAVAEIITQIENYGAEKLVMFAGYGGISVEPGDNLMKTFIDSNPGLKSRINSTIYFDSYTPEQMVEIVHLQAKNQSFILNRRADPEILAYFKERITDRNFGNGREARSLLENAMVFAAARIIKIPAGEVKKRQLQEITVSDVRKALERMRKSNLMQMGRNKKRKMGFE